MILLDTLPSVDTIEHMTTATSGRARLANRQAVAIDPDALRPACAGSPRPLTGTSVVEACASDRGMRGSLRRYRQRDHARDEQNVHAMSPLRRPRANALRWWSDTGQGPCTEAFVNNTSAVASTYVTAEERWPDLAVALRPHRVRAVLGLPVRLGAVTVGTLDVYYDRPHVWQDDECQALGRYRDVIESTLAAAVAAQNAGELAAQLQYALDYRVIIERGVGYLMARDHVDSITAFNRLRRAARDTQAKIGDVAQRLLSTGRLPTEAPRAVAP
jgi:GAF domain-containing protein